ncbi:MAG: GIY-YIG nuclease family protein [Desulfobacterales bacterium]|jgi:putative endonuclease
MQKTDEWYVYMIRCRNGSLYTGIATDVERRFAEHRSNGGAKYLRGRGPLTLVFKLRVGPRSRALKVERNIKRLPKQRKETLVETGAGLEAVLASPVR